MERRVTRSRWSAAKWVLPLLVIVAAFAAVKLGWVGFGWAQVRSAYFPRDESLLEWLPGDTTAVAILDPHQVKARVLAADAGFLGPPLTRIRADVLKLTGVDLAFDVDKVAISPTVAVMRGRFDADRLASKLSENRYVKADHEGHSYLVRAGEDAVLVAGDEYLIYGDENAIKASIDARGSGTSLATNDGVTDRLAKIGWNHPFIATVLLVDDRPSLRSVLSGATGPRAVTGALSAGQGIDVRTLVDTGSANAADELAKLLEERRLNLAQSLPLATGPDLAAQLGLVAKDATVHADPGAGQVEVRIHVSPETLGAVFNAAEKSPVWSEAYKTFRLYQLLAPAP